MIDAVIVGPAATKGCQMTRPKTSIRRTGSFRPQFRPIGVREEAPLYALPKASRGRRDDATSSGGQGASEDCQADERSRPEMRLLDSSEGELDLVRLDPQWRCFFEASSVLDLEQDVDTMNELAEESRLRSPAPFRTIVAGKVGVGGVYDLWRRPRER